MGIPPDGLEQERRSINRNLRFFDIAFKVLRKTERVTVIIMLISISGLLISSVQAQKGLLEKLGELNPIFFIIGWTCFTFFFTGFAIILVIYAIKEVIKRAQAATMEKAKALEDRINEYFSTLKDMSGSFADIRREINAISKDLAEVTGQMKIVLNDRDKPGGIWQRSTNLSNS
jgi:methyl-accepting chemotaxis protein